MSKPWTAVDWSAERPDKQQISASRAKLTFTPVDVGGEATQRLLRELRRVLTRGGAWWVGFLVDGDDVWRWFASRNRFDEYGFFEHLLRSEALRVAAPELVQDGVAPRVAEPDFFDESYTGAYTLDGWLARTLMWGGAYEHFAGTAGQAKALGVGAAHELVGDRFDEFVIYENHEPWSGWFGGVVWDTTVLVIDLAERRIYLLALTDTD